MQVVQLLLRMLQKVPWRVLPLAVEMGWNSGMDR
jgi:hypothetical protein